MKRLIAIAFLLAFNTFSAYATSACNAIVHINGINTERGEAEENRDKLKKEIGPKHANKPLNYVLGYNQTKGFLSDLADVIDQKLGEYPDTTEEDLIRFYLLAHNEDLNGTDLTIEEVKDFYVEQIRTKGYVNLNDDDLDSILADIDNAVEKEQNILLVPHSQGGLYANSVYARLTSGPDARGAKRVAIFAVGTAADYVAGGGSYLTSHKDLVVGGLDIIASVLPSNHPVSFTFRDMLGHNFRKVYLHPDLEARKEIIDNVHAVLGGFPGCCAFEVAINDNPYQYQCFNQSGLYVLGYSRDNVWYLDYAQTTNDPEKYWRRGISPLWIMDGAVAYGGSYPYGTTYIIRYQDDGGQMVIEHFTHYVHTYRAYTNGNGDFLRIGNGDWFIPDSSDAIHQGCLVRVRTR